MAGLQELVKKLTEDQAFAEAFSQIKTKEELLVKIKEAGFDVAEEVIEELLKGKEGELSDEEMEGAAGGFIIRRIRQNGDKGVEFISADPQKRFL